MSARQQRGGEARDAVHLVARLADRQPADRVTGKVERDEFAALRARSSSSSPPCTIPKSSVRSACRRAAAQRRAHARRARDGALELGARRRQLHADVERHRDVDAERFLERDDVLGREAVRAAVEVRAERDAVVVDRRAATPG